MKYKFLFDRKSGQYKGITYDDKAANTTSVRPVFAAGFVTCWCFDTSRWKLVPDESFFVQMADVELIKAVDTRIINALGLHYEAISARMDVYDRVMMGRFNAIDERVIESFDDVRKTVQGNHVDHIRRLGYIETGLSDNAKYLLGVVQREAKQNENKIVARLSYVFSLRGRWERLKAEISRWFRPL